MALLVVFHGKRRGKKTVTMVPRQSPCQHSTCSALATNGIEVFVCVSHLWIGGHDTDQKALYSLSQHATLDQRWIGDREANRSALYREWGIELRCWFTQQPAGPALYPTRLWPWQDSERSWSPGDWQGCDWSNRGGLQGRRGLAPPPRGPGKMSEGRSHRGTRPGRRKCCSRATDIPNVLHTDTETIIQYRRGCLFWGVTNWKSWASTF